MSWVRVPPEAAVFFLRKSLPQVSLNCVVLLCVYLEGVSKFVYTLCVCIYMHGLVCNVHRTGLLTLTELQ